MAALPNTSPHAVDRAEEAGRPGPGDPTDTELAARLRVAVTRLHRKLRQHSVGGLTQSQASALTSIGQLGSPTLGELAARESVRPPSMTRIVGALEETGYVSRLTDPDDRRVARVALTAKGDAVLRRSRSRKTAYLAAQLYRLPAEDRRALADLTGLLEHLASLEEP
ncbi:MAG: MarR family winged helix-turn-helix transcriptional regulator [Acidimicrobiales bacterium]